MLPFLAPMLAGKGLKILIVVVIVAAIGGTIFAGYRVFVGMQERLQAQAQAIAVHEANEAAYKALIRSKESRIKEMTRAREVSDQLRRVADASIAKARERTQTLESKLIKYDLNKHATRKPRTLEKAMARATRRVFAEAEALANQK